MVVAFATAHRRAEPCGGNRARTIRGVFGQIFLRLRAAFARHHVQAIEARGDELFGRWVGQEIAGKLFNGELVERFVPVERIDDVIAIRKHVHVLVPMIPHRVRKPHQIEPRHRHPLAKMGRLHQAIDLAFVSFRTRILEKRIHLLRRWRQADEVKAQPTQQRALVRFRRRLDTPTFERVQDEHVDWIPHPLRMLCVRWRWPRRFDVSPVRLVFRPFGDPSCQQLLLFGRQDFVGLRRQHQVVRIRGVDALDQLAFVRLAGKNRFLFHRDLAHVQP